VTSPTGGRNHDANSPEVAAPNALLHDEARRILTQCSQATAPQNPKCC